MTVLLAARRASAPRLTTPPKTFLTHLGLIAAGVMMFYPLAWMLGASFRDDSRINDAGIWPGSAFTVSGYTTGMAGLSGVPFWRFIANSILVSTLCVAANLVACSLTAYAFARIDFRFKGLLFGILITTLVLPSVMFLVPQFKLIGTIVELVEKYQTRETSAEAVPRALTTAPPRDRGFWTFGRRARLV